MYSRYHNSKAIQIPENYSGCAFSEQKPIFPSTKPAPREHFTPPAEVRRVEVAKPTLPEVKEPVTETKRNEPEPPPQKEESSSALPVSSFFGGLGKGLPLSHGLGFEELLLLGLILLLSQTEQSSDIVLWLALLLFCG
ncbi:MAG: hypothetical protein IJW49_08465 [Clostridia bacterium]|nr:hypothetical protein [Clostridia bacterium]